MSAGEFVERFALVGAWMAEIVVFSVLKPDTFATSSNFAAILGSQAVLVVLTCALLIPLTAGDQLTGERIAEQCYRAAESHSGSHLDAGGGAR